MKRMIVLATAVTSMMFSSSSFAANLDVKCYKGSISKKGVVALMSFEVANTPSKRLVSDLQEVRSTTDSETLPSFLVSQYAFQSREFMMEVDDGSAAGNVIAQLQGRFTGKKSSDGLLYQGQYRRLDTGRQLSTSVSCFVK